MAHQPSGAAFERLRDVGVEENKGFDLLNAPEVYVFIVILAV